MSIPICVIEIIASYLVEYKTKLLDWIDINKLNWTWLSINPNSLCLLLKHPEKINWMWLSTNININNMTILLDTYPEMVNWMYLSENPNAIDYLKSNIKNINWDFLSRNPMAIELLKANPEKINWHMLSTNEGAISILEANPEKINWHMLPNNINAGKLLEENPEKIKDMPLLHYKTKDINWDLLSSDPNIFEIDKKQYELDIIETAKFIDNILHN